MDIYEALAVPTRRQIVKLVATSGQLTATAISGKFKVSPQAVSQHLQALRNAKILHMEKWGREHIYMVEPKAFDELETYLHDLKKLWHGRLDRLGALLEVESRKSKKKGKK